MLLKEKKLKKFKKAVVVVLTPVLNLVLNLVFGVLEVPFLLDWQLLNDNMK